MFVDFVVAFLEGRKFVMPNISGRVENKPAFLVDWPTRLDKIKAEAA